MSATARGASGLSLTVDFSAAGLGGRTAHIPVTRSTPLTQVRNEACAKAGLDKSSYGLSHKRKTLDLSLSFRLSNLTPNARLDLVPQRSSKAPINFAVDVQFPGGSRKRVHHSSAPDVTLGSMLAQLEPDLGGAGSIFGRTDGSNRPMQPFVSILQRRLGRQEILSSTPASLGLVGGSHLLRVGFEAGGDEDGQTTTCGPQTVADPAKSADDALGEPSAAAEDAASTLAPMALEASAARATAAGSAVGGSPDVAAAGSALPAEPTVYNAAAADNADADERTSAPQQEPGATFAQVESGADARSATAEAMAGVRREAGRAVLAAAMAEEVAAPAADEAPTRDATADAAQEADAAAIDRAVRVFRPSEAQQSISRIQVPEEFYNFTEGDLRSELQRQNRAQNDPRRNVLRTRAMRQADDHRQMMRYSRCLIRIRLPDRACVQATFRPSERIAAVYAMLRTQLRDSGAAFRLAVTPPLRYIDDSRELSLWALGFVPATLLYFVAGGDGGPKLVADGEPLSCSVLLSDDALARMEELPAATPPPTDAEGSGSSFGEAAEATEANAAHIDGDDGAADEREPQRTHASATSPVNNFDEHLDWPAAPPRANGAPKAAVPKWFRMGK